VRWRRGFFHLHVHAHESGLHAHGHVHGGGGHPHRTARARRPAPGVRIGVVPGMGGSAASASCLASIHDRAIAAAAGGVRALHRSLVTTLCWPRLHAQPWAHGGIFPRVAPVLAVVSRSSGLVCPEPSTSRLLSVDGGRSPLARGALAPCARRRGGAHLRGAPRVCDAAAGNSQAWGSGLKLAYGAAGPAPPPELKGGSPPRLGAGESVASLGATAQLDRATRGRGWNRAAAVASASASGRRRPSGSSALAGARQAGLALVPMGDPVSWPWLERRGGPARASPPAPSGKTYEAWVIRGGKTLRNLSEATATDVEVEGAFPAGRSSRSRSSGPVGSAVRRRSLSQPPGPMS
jgi:hypothetical protein